MNPHRLKDKRLGGWRQLKHGVSSADQQNQKNKFVLDQRVAVERVFGRCTELDWALVQVWLIHDVSDKFTGQQICYLDYLRTIV